MRVVLAFLEFLEGKHGIHANPFNYTLLLNNPPGALHGNPSQSDSRAGCTHSTPEGRARLRLPLRGLTQVGRAWLSGALGLPSFPGLIGFPPEVSGT